jgi:hypothetical protein
MPSGRNDETYNRLQNESERESRRLYLLSHPGLDERLIPATLAGFAWVQDWLDAGSPDATACRCPQHADQR